MSNPNLTGVSALTAAVVLDGHAVFESIPLGTTLRYFDGTPKPPERHNRKLRAWQSRNGIGRLVEKSPPSTLGSQFPEYFTLHEGDYGIDGTIVMVVRRIYPVTTDQHFEIIERPAPGMVRVLHRWNDRSELKHLATDMAAAEAWMAKNRGSDLFIEIVSDDESAAGMGKAA